MISSVFTMKESNTISRNIIPVSETVLVENYYTNKTMDFMLECHRELLSSRQEFYKTVLEASDQYVINESFNDVIKTIKKIIQKILAYIDSIIKRFSTQLHKFVKSDKYINKKRNDIAKFPSDGSFDISGYTFTFNDNVPVVDCIDLSEIKDELQSVSSENVLTKIGKVEEINLKLKNDSLDDICGKILNTESISQVSFTDEVFSVYRDGDSSESDITIEKSDVNRALDDFNHYDSKIKDAKRLQSNVTKRYKTLETQADSIVKNNIMPDGTGRIEDALGSLEGTQDEKNKLLYSLNNLVTNLVARIQKICSLHTQAIAGKLDAYNASVIQDRNILYEALSMVQKDIKNSKFMKESLDLSVPCRPYDYARYSDNRFALYEYYHMNLKQQRLVQECITLSEGNILEADAINEALKMDVKGKFEKFIAFIKSVYEKFLMKMNKLLTNNKDFLEKYKDIILKTKIDEYDINNMPNYAAGIKNITENKLPNIDIKKNIDKTEDDIKVLVLPAYKGHEGDDFTDFCKRYFLCNNEPNKETVKSSELNMAVLYEFCTNAQTALKQLENDQKEYETIAKGIAAGVQRAASETKPANESALTEYYLIEAFRKKAKQQNTTNQQSNTKPEGKIVNTTKNTETNTTNNATAKPNLDINSATKNAEDNKDQKDQLDRNKDLTNNVKQDENDKGKDAEKQKEENKNSDAKKIEESSTWFLKALQTLCTAKITAFQKIYSEYMTILRYHVSHATGSMGKTGDFSDEDQKEILDELKKYKNASSKDEKESIGNRIIGIYKAKHMTIDMHDVESLVSKNSKLLEG